MPRNQRLANVLAVIVSITVPAALHCTPADAASKAKAASTPTRSARKCAPVTHRRRSGHARSSAYLVPPPPAYMPSMMQALASHRPMDNETEQEVKAENRYQKYIHTPSGDAPEPLQERKGVVTWTRRS